jgi:GDP-L-fucose synthase
MQKTSKIYITGHSGLVGTALIAELNARGYLNILTASHSQLDLVNQSDTFDFFAQHKPDYVIHLAAKVGGIIGNRTYPADFIYENVQITTNVLQAAHLNKVKKLLNFGSICIYPVHAEVPVREDSLLTGPLEYTNEAYAVAKIAGLMMAKKYREQYGDNFINVMPSNLYGPKDNFHPQNAHVLPMLMARFHQAKISNQPKVEVWGTGKPTRDFLFSEDLAKGLIFLMDNYDQAEHINIGPGYEISIGDAAQLVKQVVGFEGKLEFNPSKPDGTPRRYLDVTKINALGWKAETSLEDGLTKMYEWYKQNLLD